MAEIEPGTSQKQSIHFTDIPVLTSDNNEPLQLTEVVKITREINAVSILCLGSKPPPPFFFGKLFYQRCVSYRNIRQAPTGTRELTS